MAPSVVHPATGLSEILELPNIRVLQNDVTAVLGDAEFTICFNIMQISEQRQVVLQPLRKTPSQCSTLLGEISLVPKQIGKLRIALIAAHVLVPNTNISMPRLCFNGSHHTLARVYGRQTAFLLLSSNSPFMAQLMRCTSHVLAQQRVCAGLSRVA
jgi:hypothetical protein